MAGNVKQASRVEGIRGNQEGKLLRLSLQINNLILFLY